MEKNKTATPGQATSAGATIRINLECHTDPGIHHFDVSPDLEINAFIQRVMQRLAEGDNGERVRAMLAYYEPILELMESGTASRVLDSSKTLQQACVHDNATCRISANPRKEKIMFCSYCT
jgi:hypothetical protein